MTNSLLKQSVQFILEHATSFSWSLQGLGMLRLYLSQSLRLHVWNSEYAVPNVSRLHTHPWNFDSYVVAGNLTNNRYQQVAIDELPQGQLRIIKRPWVEFYRQQILCGPGGCLMDDPTKVFLEHVGAEHYGYGCTYGQEASEVHDTVAANGTVTLVTRQFLPDKDHAYVYWNDGEWVSAEPRPATSEEILAITQHSLATYFR